MTTSSTPVHPPVNPPVNPHLNFVLVAYGNASALPGTSPAPTLEASQRSLAGMLVHAMFAARSAGPAVQEVAEEAVSRTLLDIARSKLVENYRPGPWGIRPWVNAIIRCQVQEILAERRAPGMASLPTT